MRARCFFLLAFAAFSLSAFADNLSTPATPQMQAQYRIVRESFWQGENQLQARLDDGEERAALFSPLAADDPQREEYSHAALAADDYLKLATQSKTQVAPAMLYLGGLAKYSLGDNAGALQLLERLRTEFPDYQREMYFRDDEPAPSEYSTPTASGISKLIFFLRLQVALKNTPDAFASIKQITNDALSTLNLQNGYAQLVASRSDKFNHYEFDEGIFGSQPDQRRAGALPSTLVLVSQAWDKLIESALQRSGPQAMREWLRSLSNPNAPLSKLALYRLQSVDALIIKQLFADAQNAINAHDYDGARAKYRQLIAEYPDTPTAQQAADALPQIVPVAVNFYKGEGEKNFRAAEPDQFMKAQTQSREFYEKAYKEDPDGPQSAEMLYGWARGLATEPSHVRDATTLMEQWMAKYPQEQTLRVKALAQMVLFYGAQRKRYPDAIKLIDQMVTEYPQAPETADAVWLAAFLWVGIADGGREGYEKGLPYLEKYYKDYPNEPCAPNALKWVNRFKEKLQ